jgi:hypothetical protein
METIPKFKAVIVMDAAPCSRMMAGALANEHRRFEYRD